MTAYGQGHPMEPPGEAPIVSRSALACHVCKRRKSKCDRTLPSCATCLKSNQPCLYPDSAQKPGPKTGFYHQSKKRNRNDKNGDGRQSQRILGDLKFRGVQSEDSAATNTASTSNSLQQGVVSMYNSGAEFSNHNPLALNSSILPPPVPSLNTTRLPDNLPMKSNSLVELIHPYHHSQEQARAPPDLRKLSYQEDEASAIKRIVSEVCGEFRISTESYHILLNAYFENMTSFSLFHRPRFDAKLREIPSQLQVNALLASMFTFSARFCKGGLGENRAEIPSSNNFHDIAVRLGDEALEACQEDTPPLCILQTMILINFQLLINGVRSRAWRYLGTCVRIAYDLELHQIDRKKSHEYDFNVEKNMEKWIVAEERRRAWWTLWEFDCFASAIKRLPAAIDWSQNETWLPVDDEFWFNNKFCPSCTLSEDPYQRWKILERSGNKGGKAWFLVINGLMRNAQLVSLRKPKEVETQHSRFDEDIGKEMSTLSDAVRCFAMALPLALCHRGEFLSFRPTRYSSTPASLQNDCDKYSIHIMIQLARFMVYYSQVFRSTGRDASATGYPIHNTGTSKDTAIRNPNHGAWSRYLDGADDILTIIRNSSPDHVQYVNPFLSNGIWLAASAQIAARVLGAQVGNPQVNESNLDLLRLVLNRYVSFWSLSDLLQDRLNSLESRLQNVRAGGQDIPRTGQGSRTMDERPKAFAEPVENLTETLPTVQRHDRPEEFTPMPFYQPETLTASSATASFADPAYLSPAVGVNLGGFQLTGYEHLSTYELEELFFFGLGGGQLAVGGGDGGLYSVQ